MHLARLLVAALVPSALLIGACSAAPDSETTGASGEAVIVKPGPVQGPPPGACNAGAGTVYEECSGRQTPVGSGGSCICMPWCGGVGQLGCAPTGVLTDRQGCNPGLVPAFTWVDDQGTWKEEGATCVQASSITGNIRVIYTSLNSETGQGIVSVEATTSGAGNAPFTLGFSTPYWGSTTMGPFFPTSTGPTGAFESFTVPPCGGAVTVTMYPYTGSGASTNVLNAPWAQTTIDVPTGGTWSVGGGSCCIDHGIEMPCSGVTVVSGSSGGGSGSSGGGSGSGSSGGGGSCALISCYMNDAEDYLGQFCDLEDAEAFESEQGGDAALVYCM